MPMGNIRVAMGWLVGLMLVACVAGLPRPAVAATCNGFIEMNYISGPQPALPGDTLRMQMIMFTGSITDGANPTLMFNRVRFDLDCDDNFPIGLGCVDDGSVVQ